MTADEIIDLLQLKPHPKEDGFFVETYRSAESFSWESLPARYNGARNHSTGIYFLLKAGGFSEMHRLRSDEIFHFYSGAPADLLLLFPDGDGSLLRIGADLQAGERPQVVVPRGCWQGLRTTGEFTLLGTTVAPGFDYSDYESGKRDELTSQYPKFAMLIQQFTRR